MAWGPWARTAGSSCVCPKVERAFLSTFGVNCGCWKLAEFFRIFRKGRPMFSKIPVPLLATKTWGDTLGLPSNAAARIPKMKVVSMAFCSTFRGNWTGPKVSKLKLASVACNFVTNNRYRTSTAISWGLHLLPVEDDVLCLLTSSGVSSLRLCKLHLARSGNSPN